MRSYRVGYGGETWDAKTNDVIELDLTAEEEAEFVRRGRLLLVEQSYEVTGDNEVFEHHQGEKFSAVMTLDQEQALIEGGHIKPVKARKKSTDESTKGGKS